MDSRSVEQLSRRIIDALRERGLLLADARIDLDTPLVSSGLIDSFGLVEVLEVLEGVSGLAIPPGRVGPQDLDSVRSMLEVTAQWGRKVPTG